MLSRLTFHTRVYYISTRTEVLTRDTHVALG